MHEVDQQSLIREYENRLQEFGYSPLTVDMGQHHRRDVRFSVMAEYALNDPTGSVLDVGCGFADLYEYLTQNGWQGKYTGIDLVPGLLQSARDRLPDLDLRQVDMSAREVNIEPHDYVIALGIFNHKLDKTENLTYISQALKNMHHCAKKVVSADFLSTYVDFQKPMSWHTNPGWVFDAAKQISRRVLLRHDYIPYEFGLFMFADDAISERNVFQGFEESLA
jgi:ubiquinone/menaquinone biosynthesis C-methylase UbiE